MKVDIERIKKSGLLKMWKNEALNLISVVNGGKIPSNYVNDKLDELISKRLKNSNVTLHNNYNNMTQETTLLDTLDWIILNKPILTPSGTLFKQHSQAENPIADILEELGKDRKAFKKLAHKAAENLGYASEEFKVNNRKQLSEKVDMNAMYGAHGEGSSQFYNLYVATAITSTARAVISQSTSNFERLLANNLRFLSISDCMNFMMQVIAESKTFLSVSDWIGDNISRVHLYNRMLGTFLNEDELTDKDKLKIKNFIDQLNDEEVTRIYYKNNLYEFCSLPNISCILKDIINILCTQREYKTVKSDGKIKYDLDKVFIDPNMVPAVVQSEFATFYSLIDEFVSHKFQTFDRMNKLLHFERQAIITIDTDSNFVNLNPWYEFCVNDIVGEDIATYGQDPIEIDTNILNIMSCICTWHINESLIKYGHEWGIELESKCELINFKNEFHMVVVVLTPNKKNYASLIARQESAMINPMEMDIKGLGIIKSEITPEMQKKLQDILEHEVLRADIINTGNVVRRLSKVEEEITVSLKNGEPTYLKPAKIKSPEFYANPSSMGGLNGVAVWNTIYPEQAIQLPSVVTLIKVKMQKMSQIESLADSHREIFDTLVDKFYKCGVESIEKKGISWIAIPADLESTPLWIRDFIDYDTIVNDNLSKFASVLEALGIVELPTFESNSSYSNIVKI